MRKGLVHRPPLVGVGNRRLATRATRLFATVWLGLLLGVVTAQGLPEWFPYTFTAELSGDQLVPPVENEGGGTVVAVLTGNQLVVAGSFQGMGVIGLGSGAAIHQAPRGETGPMLELAAVPGSFMNGSYLYPPGHAGDSGTLSATFTLTDEQVQDLQAGLWYVQVGTGSETRQLRGQLVPEIDLSRIDVDPAAVALAAEDFSGVWIAEDDEWGFQYYPDGKWTYLDGVHQVGETPSPSRTWVLRDNVLLQNNRMVGGGTCSGHHIWLLEPSADDTVRMQLLWGPRGCGDVGTGWTYGRYSEP